MRFASKIRNPRAFALAFALCLGSAAPSYGGFVWKGQDWDVSGGTAALDGSGNAVLTATGTGDVFLHLNRILPAGSGGSGSFINDNGTPWIQFSYIDNTASTSGGRTQGTDLLIEQEGTPDVRAQAGTLFGYAGIAWDRYNSTENVVFAGGTPSAGASHSVLIGRLADGTLDYVFDGVLYSTADLVGKGFNFNDVYLRLRKPDAGGTATFTSFQYGNDAPAVVPEPSTLVSGGLGLLSLAGFGWFRRKRSA